MFAIYKYFQARPLVLKSILLKKLLQITDIRNLNIDFDHSLISIKITN